MLIFYLLLCYAYIFTHSIGTFPLFVFSLQSLIHISLCNNFLYGTIPPSLSLLSRLLYFDVSYNFFNGTIPYELSLLTNLQFIKWSNNEFIGNFSILIITLCTFCSKFFILYTNYNHIGTVPGSIGNLKKLTFLSLNNNYITGCLYLFIYLFIVFNSLFAICQ